MGLGGVSTYLAHLANGLAERHRVILFDQYPYVSDYKAVSFLSTKVVRESVLNRPWCDRINWAVAGALSKSGISVHHWENSRKRYFLKVLRKYHVDVITSFDKYSDKLVLEAVGGSIPLVLSLHGSYDISEYAKLTDEEIKLYEPLFRQVKAVVYKSACNIRVLDHYQDLHNILTVKRIFHGFTAVPPKGDPAAYRKQLGIPQDAFVFVMVARGVPEKGWKEAMDAFLSAAATSGLNTHFVAIGGSEHLNELKQAYAGEDRIHFTGFVEHPLEWINACDAGVLPTYARTENFTFSVVEYLFCGKPAIASDHGEISTTLDAGEGKAGILVPNKDGKPDVAGFTAAMMAYLTDPVLYRQHRSLTGKAFGKFDSKRAVEAYEAVFRMVTAGGKAGD